MSRECLNTMEDVRLIWKGKNVLFRVRHWKDFTYIVRVLDKKTKRELCSYTVTSMRDITQ